MTEIDADDVTVQSMSLQGEDTEAGEDEDDMEEDVPRSFSQAVETDSED